ncbi:OsmC family protein [Flavobacterium sp. F-328]|jgi:putative redox protein|uniref:OsmC family protein n=2 Tax=Flavobacteriales TaxID=200644 RepID=A0A9Q3UZX2_9FLAO|nr:MULTISPECIES: OsmC family protein [Flavobacteriales]MBD3906613.1 OsmC family protein [Chryseobacterium muglaense]MBQ0909688.1 OsmC family protein [Flavobacterium erciyesense]MCC9036571.1 OsmC family protein [Chryseobacterium muglaense]MCM2556244.1 OsmC family protein [Chryseobacterium muglaense]|tara:strand:+ start:2017 stop:2430 length:414 start_codon:yes stop_codon:yes gene_type:complete
MATVIKIKNLQEGYQSIITNGTHSIVGDEPVKSKGTDLGLSPSELVLSGLAMCKVATVRYIARQKGWEIGEVKAELSQEVKRDSDGLKTTIQVAINIEGNISQVQKDELLKQANACYIHRQIMGEWNIEHASWLNEE